MHVDESMVPSIGSKMDDAVERIKDFLLEFEGEIDLRHVDYISVVRIALRRFLSESEKRHDEDKNTEGGR